MSPRKRPARRRGPGWKEYFLAMCVTVLTGLVVGVLVGEAYTPGDGASKGDPTANEGGGLLSGFSPKNFTLVPTLRDPLNVLIMACDVNFVEKNGKREMGLNGNTDTMIVARFDPATEQVRMLSIPRDTRVPIPGHGTFKINAANPYGGPALSARVVADFLNVTVDRYVLFNTRAVIQLVDAIGGINVNVAKSMNYDDWSGKLHIHLKKGPNHLDGQKAHDFLRFRHDELGDIGRVQRQQQFLQAVVAQYMTPANLLKTPQLLGVAKENLETNLTNDELVKLCTWGKDLRRDKIQLTMVPGSATTIDQVSYWVADEVATRRVVSGFLQASGTDETRSPRAYKVTIRDGVGDRSSVRNLKRVITEAGYGSVDVEGQAPDLGQAETEIIAQNADLAGARSLADRLGVGKVVVAATGSIYSDFTVVMGKDWLAHEAQHLNARRP
ncbi:MAG: cell envelope-related transcriptional attenuator [Cyanobacteria bacterium RYN_339]|nr:cell envelope-related transcriptional attenuator [Cyanobacteria bacterium RYN_339]